MKKWKNCKKYTGGILAKDPQGRINQTKKRQKSTWNLKTGKEEQKTNYATNFRNDISKYLFSSNHEKRNIHKDLKA